MQPTTTDTDEARIRRFLAIASHDLQSPLRHIAMYADILIDDLGDGLDAEHLDYLKTILAKTQAAQALTKALLGLAAGAPQLSTETVEPGGLVANIWAELRAEIDAPGATLQVAALPAVVTDSGVLRSVLRGILANALVHRGESALIVTVTAETTAAEWICRVSDNGPGIKPELHGNIFEAFWSLPKPGAEKRIGMGLTAARELAVALGGTVRLDRSDESGSCFSIHMPRQ